MSNDPKKCNCLGCGNPLVKADPLTNYCEDCFINMDLHLKIEKKDEVIGYLELLLDRFVSDVTGAFHKDPAAKSIVEVLTSYPGIHAVLLYRVAHLLWQIGMPFVPRYLSYIAHQNTGIDIHPGAKIGKNFFIDHGQGVVIGETSEIGDNVTLYQGVTLGGTSLEDKKRHPTLGNNIIVGAGAKILGPILIGDDVKIGANSVVTKNIPPNSIVVGVPGRIIEGDASLHDQIDHLLHGNLPDPVLKLIDLLENRIKCLEDKVKAQEDQNKPPTEAQNETEKQTLKEEK